MDSEQATMRFMMDREHFRDKVTLVCGGRDFNDKDFLFETLDKYQISCIVHGGASGADSLAGEWAWSKGIPEIVVPAQWKNFGKSAGFLRNEWMIKFIKIEFALAFPGGKGTADMVQRLRRNKIGLFEVVR